MCKMKLILTLHAYTVLILTVDHSMQRPVNNVNHKIRKTKRDTKQVGSDKELPLNTTNVEKIENYTALENDPDWCNGKEVVLISVSYLKNSNGVLYNVTESVLMCNGSDIKLYENETESDNEPIVVLMNVTEMTPIKKSLIEIIETTVSVGRKDNISINVNTLPVWEVTNKIPLLWNVSEEETTTETKYSVWTSTQPSSTIPYIRLVHNSTVKRNTPQSVVIETEVPLSDDIEAEVPISDDIETEVPKPSIHTEAPKLNIKTEDTKSTARETLTTLEELENATAADIVETSEPELANRWYYQDKDSCSDPGAYRIVENTATENSSLNLMDDEIDMYPYLVALQTDKFGMIGTGSIISSQAVLVAAHLLCCWKNNDVGTNLYVLAGTTDLENYDQTYQKIYVETYIYHPNFDPQNYPQNSANDIALLQTIIKFSFDDFVQPILVPRPNEFGVELPSYVASSCETISWKVDENVVLRIFPSRVYMQPNSECFKNSPATAETHFCSITRPFRCAHEGPLICDGSLVGLQSFVDADCKKKKGNAYWTRVDRNMFWLLRFMPKLLRNSGREKSLNVLVLLVCIFKIKLDLL